MDNKFMDIDENLKKFFLNKGKCNNEILSVKRLIRRFIENGSYLYSYFAVNVKDMDFKLDYLENENESTEGIKSFSVFDNGKEYTLVMTQAVFKIFDFAKCISEIMGEKELSFQTFESNFIISTNKILIDYCKELKINFWDLFCEIVSINTELVRTRREIC